MTEQLVAIIVAVIGGLGGLAGALVAGREARRARVANRAAELEQRIAQRDKDNYRLWYWNRQLVDQIYRGKPPPPAAPPPGLFE